MLWAANRIGPLSRNATGISAIRADGSLAGVVAYDAWTPASCQMHVVVDCVAACRALLRPAFAYPFSEAGLRIARAVIPSHRWKAVRLAKRLGFVESHRIKDGWDVGSDLVHFELRREACRYLLPLAKAA